MTERTVWKGPQHADVASPLLQLKNVRKEFRIGGGFGLFNKPVIALDDVSMALPADKILALVGESGSGKTTIAKLIMGLESPTAGELLYRGHDIGEWIRRNELAYRREVQMIFQDPYSTYNPFYRVDRILYSAVRKFKLASTREDADELVVDSMRQLGLRPEYILGRYPHQLSGGERQRLMLCRILMIKPRLIVADEPVSMLDASLRSTFLESLLRVKETLDMSCLYITHDIGMAHHVSDLLTVLLHGSVMEQGPSADVIDQPLHPYSRLLIDSMPRPDPRQRWPAVQESDTSNVTEPKPNRGCKFSPRCPHVMKVCREQDPPVVDAGGRQVACFLYEQQ